MNYRVLVSLVVLGAGVAGASYFLSPRAVPISEERSRDASEELKVLKAEVDALRREARSNAYGVEALRAETGRISEAMVAPAPGDVSHPPEQPRSVPARDSEERLAWEAERKVMIAALEANFQTEVRDAEWSSRTSSSIRDLADKRGAAPKILRDVDCRSKTCRIEVIEDASSASELHEFLVDCSMVFPEIVADHVVGADNQSSYVMYFKSEA